MQHPTMQAPKYAQPGRESAGTTKLCLELKVIADVGLGWIPKCWKIYIFIKSNKRKIQRLQIIISQH